MGHKHGQRFHPVQIITGMRCVADQSFFVEFFICSHDETAKNQMNKLCA